MNLLSSPPLAMLMQSVQQVAAPIDPDLQGTMWMPVQGSTVAAQMDWVFYYVYWISVVFTAIIVGVMIFFALRYRHRKGVWDGEKSANHGLLLEVTWSVIPFLLTIVMWWEGVDSFVKSDTPPENAMEIRVMAYQWNWQFRYPNGEVLPELHIPAGQPVTFVMSSDNVLHSFWVPAWRVKRDVVPGRYTRVWVDATIPGEFALFCTEYCGKDHSLMLAQVYVHPTEAQLADFEARGIETDMQTYEDWYDEAFQGFDPSLSPAEIGEMAYTKWGCIACHNLDGSPSTIAPTWKGLFGKTEQLTDGSSVVVDENYLRSSILDPMGQVVEGYTPNMPAVGSLMKPEEIDGLIAFIKTLSN